MLSRRQIFITAVSFAPFSRLLCRQTYFKADFKRHLNGVCFEKFTQERLQYENEELFMYVNKLYLGKNKIISADFQRDGDELTWTYVFSTENDYAAWKEDIVKMGCTKEHPIQKEDHHKVKCYFSMV